MDFQDEFIFELKVKRGKPCFPPNLDSPEISKSQKFMTSTFS